VIKRDIHREGQLFWFVKTGNVFLIVGRVHHEESNQEVWNAVDLRSGEETVFSEDFLKIKEKSSRFA